MNNIDFTGAALLKLIGIAVATVLGASQLSFSTGFWSGNVETRLVVVEKKIDLLDNKVDKNFRILDNKISSLDAKFDNKIDALASKIDKRFQALDSKIDQNFHKIIDLLKK